jgi:hypothetical protein
MKITFREPSQRDRCSFDSTPGNGWLFRGASGNVCVECVWLAIDSLADMSEPGDICMFCQAGSGGARRFVVNLCEVCVRRLYRLTQPEGWGLEVESQDSPGAALSSALS